MLGCLSNWMIVTGKQCRLKGVQVSCRNDNDGKRETMKCDKGSMALKS